jgi:hypothetical protein
VQRVPQVVVTEIGDEIAARPFEPQVVPRGLISSSGLPLPHLLHRSDENLRRLPATVSDIEAADSGTLAKIVNSTAYDSDFAASETAPKSFRPWV